MNMKLYYQKELLNKSINGNMEAYSKLLLSIKASLVI